MKKTASIVIAILLNITMLTACASGLKIETSIGSFELTQVAFKSEYADISPTEGNRFLLVYLKAKNYSDELTNDIQPYFCPGDPEKQNATVSLAYDSESAIECSRISYEQGSGSNIIFVLIFDVPADWSREEISMKLPVPDNSIYNIK